MNIERLPVKYRRPRQINGRNVWDAPEPSDLMVWEICPYIEGHNGLIDGCQQCPPWEDDPKYGKIKRGCRGLAEEACRVVMAVQRREAEGLE